MNRTGQALVACAIGLSILSAPALGAEPGTTRKATELREAPFRDAPVLGVLPRGDAVEIRHKRGGWYEVTSGELDGWVHMLSIRRARARRAAVDMGELAALATGRAGTGQVVSTTGIRGLSEKDMRLARYAEAELGKLDTYAVSHTQAKKFAREGGLAARRQD